jgi:hypothetical protein
MKKENKQLYISDITEAQDWSQKMGQAQYLQADDKKKKVVKNKKKVANKMK